MTLGWAPGPIASNGNTWSLASGRGLFFIDGAGTLLCSDKPELDWFKQLTWDGQTWDGQSFILVRNEPDYGGDVSVARLAAPCEGPSAEGTLGARGRSGKQIAVASHGGGSSLIAYTEWMDYYSSEVPDDVRIIVQKVTFYEDSKRRPVRRSIP